jgi:hypothetical protein
MNEPSAVEQGLYALLTGDSALRAAMGARDSGVHYWFRGAALPGTNWETPRVYGIFRQYSGVAIRATGPRRIGMRLRYQVFVACKGYSTTPLVAAAERLSALLETGPIPIVGGRTYAVQVAEAFTRSPADAGVTYQELGYMIALAAEPAAA